MINKLLLSYPCYLVKSINKVRLNLMWCVYVCSYTYTYTFYLLRSMRHIHGWLGMSEYSRVWGNQKTLLLSFSHCGETRQCLLLNQEHICSATLASQQALGICWPLSPSAGVTDKYNHSWLEHIYSTSLLETLIRPSGPYGPSLHK